MGLFSTAMKAELSKGVSKPGSPEIVVGLDVALPSGTILLSDTGSPSSARGQYEPRLISLPPIERGVDLVSPEIRQMDLQVEIADAERSFGRETERYRRTIRRSPATIRVMSPNVTDGDSLVALTALLGATSPIDPPLRWSLQLQGDDRALTGDVPDLLISAFEWPDADPAVLGLPVPIIYGPHSSVGLGVKGMRPTYLVDRSGYRYLVARGWVSDVPRVWCGDTQQAASAYSISRTTVNGIRFTLVDFSASPGTDPVRVDVIGYTDDAAGTVGTVLNSPEEQILHFCANFVFNSYRDGSWVTASTTPVDTSSFTALGAFCSTFGFSGSRWIGGDQEQIRELLATWAEGWGFRWYQTPAGKLALGTIDHRPPATLYPSDWIRGDEEDIGRSLEPTSLDRIVRTIEAKYIPRDDQYAESLRVTDLDVVEVIREVLEMPGSAAEI